MSCDMERKSTEHSWFVHQVHHCVLKAKLFRFEVFRASKRRNANRLAKDRAQGRERSGHDEPVPAFHPPAARIFHVDRHNRRAAFLREKDHTLANLIDRTTWTIRRE